MVPTRSPVWSPLGHCVPKYYDFLPGDIDKCFLCFFCPFRGNKGFFFALHQPQDAATIPGQLWSSRSDLTANYNSFIGASPDGAVYDHLNSEQPSGVLAVEGLYCARTRGPVQACVTAEFLCLYFLMQPWAIGSEENGGSALLQSYGH